MNERDIPVKVVMEQRILRGADDHSIQRVATVYIAGQEYRVCAPPRATGDAVDWIDHFEVRQYGEMGADVQVRDADAVLALKAAAEELAKQKRADSIASGKTPDGDYCNAQICLQGHIRACDGWSFNRDEHCPKCGSACIDVCPACDEPIRGKTIYRSTNYELPAFCHKCGHPYPWMEARLTIARELLKNDDKLTLDEREALWELLRYIMSDPKADLVPARKKMIEIKLQKAAQATREVVLDFMAKVAVETLKP